MNYTENFINKSISVHGNRYDYSESEWVNKNTKIKIICNRKTGCIKCGNERHGEKSRLKNENLDAVFSAFDRNEIFSFFENEEIKYKSGQITPWHFIYDTQLFKDEWNKLLKNETTGKSRNNFCINLQEWYHRHMWFMNNKKPITEWESNSEVIIENRKKYSKVTPRDLRRYFKIMYMAPNLFQDSIAKYMASMIDGDVIYDPFSGFGGRMLGVSSIFKKYIGFDIECMTVDGNRGIAKELGINNVTLINNDSRNVKLTCDGIITSPPFYNKDLYGSNKWSSLEDFQSFIYDVFKNIDVRDKAIIDFKGYNECTDNDFKKALPFSKIDEMKVCFGGMARNGKPNQSYHTWFICKK